MDCMLGSKFKHDTVHCLYLGVPRPTQVDEPVLRHQSVA